MPVLSNPRWEQFSQLIALDALRPSEAYRAMGGEGDPRRQGRKLSARPEIRERIHELMETQAERRIEKALYSREDVIKGLLQNIEDARSGIETYEGEIVWERDAQGQLVKDEDGDPIPVAKMDHKAINRSWELLGLEFGMFPKQAHLMHGKLDPLEGLTLEQVLSELSGTIREITDGRVQLDTESLLRLLESGGSAHSRSSAPAHAAALPEDGGVLPL